MTQRYPSTAVPSKQAGAFYACYFGVLGVVLPFLGPFLDRNAGSTRWRSDSSRQRFLSPSSAYAPFLGRWIDRGRWFPGMLSLHWRVAIAAAVVVVRTVDPWVLGAAFLVMGLGYGTVLPLVEAAVLERPPARGYGFVRWWGSAGFIVCATLAALLLGGGRLDLFPFALLVSLVVLGLVALTLEGEARPRHSAGSGARAERRGLGPARHSDPAPGLARTVLRVSSPFTFANTESGTGLIAGLWSFAVLAEMVAFVKGASLQRRFGLRDAARPRPRTDTVALASAGAAADPADPRGRAARPRRDLCRGRTWPESSWSSSWCPPVRVETPRRFTPGSSSVSVS